MRIVRIAQMQALGYALATAKYYERKIRLEDIP
jgi:hypothetical protein